MLCPKWTPKEQSELEVNETHRYLTFGSSFLILKRASWVGWMVSALSLRANVTQASRQRQEGSPQLICTVPFMVQSLEHLLAWEMSSMLDCPDLEPLFLQRQNQGPSQKRIRKSLRLVWGTCLAGSVYRVCDSWSQGREVKPHGGCAVSLTQKPKTSLGLEVGTSWVVSRSISSLLAPSFSTRKMGGLVFALPTSQKQGL